MSPSEFAHKLRELADRPVRNDDELNQWYAAARELEASITGDLADCIPHFVWHYLADADVRLRDEGYRNDQDRQLTSALQELENAGDRSNQPLQATRRTAPRA